MKKRSMMYCLLLLAMFNLFCMFELQSEEDLHNENNLEKCYLSGDCVKIVSNKIFYGVDNVLFPLNQLFSDEYGIFILTDKKTKTIGIWNCPDCGNLNSITSSKCRVCGWPHR